VCLHASLRPPLSLSLSTHTKIHIQAVDRRERLRRLALETIDLAKDPYYFRNHLGQARRSPLRTRVFAAAAAVTAATAASLTLSSPNTHTQHNPKTKQIECRLCLTLHPNEGNYLAHTQGKRHQQSLAKRAAKEAADRAAAPAPVRSRVALKRTVKIGRPGYRVTKQYEPEAGQRSLLFQVCGVLVGGRWCVCVCVFLGVACFCTAPSIPSVQLRQIKHDNDNNISQQRHPKKTPKNNQKSTKTKKTTKTKDRVP
jgi:hypothetical protein